MSKFIRTHLTYANVISSLALLLLCGGATALAATHLGKSSVGSKQLKSGSVSAAKLKRNAVTTTKIAGDAVTGAKVDLATLGTVPSADHAITATKADDADTVDGQRVIKVNYRADGGSDRTAIFNESGLTIEASCVQGTPTLGATTTKDRSSIYSFVAADVGAADPFEDDLEGGGFDHGTLFDLLAGGNGNINLVHFEYDALDGTIVTGTLAVDSGGAVNDCLVTGDVIVG
jgi:hypothetical protein